MGSATGPVNLILVPSDPAFALSLFSIDLDRTPTALSPITAFKLSTKDAKRDSLSSKPSDP
jgi:hypothetical protein